MRSLALVVCCLPLVLSACNTVAGFGEDVSAAGDAVSNSADKMMGRSSPPQSGASVPMRQSEQQPPPPPPSPPPQ
jgi:predicted small secreted protein